MKLRFKVSTNLRFGPQESEKLKDELSELGYTRVAIIIDRGVFDDALVKKSVLSVKESGTTLDLYKNEAMEPTYSYLELFKSNLIGKKYDCIVGIGGGSTMDLAKAMAVLLTNDGPAISYRGFPKLKNRPLPVVALPTTAGSGSEATYNAVFTDDKEKRRLGINSTCNFPVCAIVDPLLTLGCPQQVVVSAGADALVHTLESYLNINHTSLSRMYSREAFRLLFNNLFKVLDNPDDLKVRSSLCLGAYLAGIALVNSGPGAAGAFSYPLGAHFNVPHGYGGAILLSSVTRLNVEKGYLDYAALYDLIEGSNSGLSAKEKNREFSGHIQRLMDKLGITRSLGKLGLGKKDVDFLCEQYDALKAPIAMNPIEITKDDISLMIRALS